MVSPRAPTLLPRRESGSTVGPDDHGRCVGLIVSRRGSLRASKGLGIEIDHIAAALLRSSPIAMGLVDPEFRFLVVNERLSQFQRFVPGDIVGQRVPDLAPEAWPILAPYYEQAAAGIPVEGVEVSVLLGDDIPIMRRELHLHPIFDDEGDDGAVFAIAIAISEEPMRRRAEEDARRKSALYAMLARAGRAGRVATSREELLHDVCQIAVESGQFVFAWVGVPDGDVLRPLTTAGDDGGYVSQITVSLDPSDPRSQGPSGQATLTGEPQVTADMLKAREFAPWWEAAQSRGLQACASFPFFEGGRVVATMAVYASEPDYFTPELVKALADLGPGVSLALDALAQERQRQEDELIRHELEDQLRQVQKMEAVGVLAGGVAHDFNNTLTVIRNTCELLERATDEQTRREYLGQIEAAADHAASLTRQLLTFSRRQVTQRMPLRADDVVAGTADLARRLVRESIDVEVSLDAPGAEVTIDRGEFQQVLLNLTVNARDAMLDGGACRISTSVVHVDSEPASEHVGLRPGDYFVLSVSDTGLGMDRATMDRIFEPFFTTKEMGTGLGLATVFGIVSACDGQVQADSAPGEGSTFTVYLPITSIRAATPAPSVAPTTVALDGTETLLLVEDSDMLRPITAKMLRARGYSVLEAAGGEEALTIAETHGDQIAVLVTDVVMPGMGGRELAEELVLRFPEIKIVYTSGYPTDTVLRHGIAEARVAFAQKPYVADDLLMLVRGVLDGAGVQG